MSQNQLSDLKSLKPDEYSELKLNSDKIRERFDQLHIDIHNASEFKQIKMAVIAYLKEAIKYLNKSIRLLEQEYSEPRFQNFNLKPVNLNVDDSSVMSLDQIENQIRNLISTIDQRVFLIKKFAYSETKAHARLLASAMIEFMEIQHLYIYPYREDLVPEFLKNIDFKDKIQSKK